MENRLMERGDIHTQTENRRRDILYEHLQIM
jgi:hypothetical protein